MKLENILSTDEIMVRRTPRIFVEWFESLLSRTKGINDDEFKTQMLIRAGLAKKFYEELFPLYRLLQTKCDSWSDVQVRNILGNQGYDVELTIKGVDRSNVPEQLETTYAVPGKEHFERMSHFATHGTTFGWNPSPEILQPEPIARCCDEIAEQTFALVKTRIEKKTGNDYGSRVGLIMYVHDDGEFMYSEERQAQLKKCFLSHWEQVKKTFQAAYLITSFSGKVFELPEIPCTEAGRHG